jgi:hypothetical protein
MSQDTAVTRQRTTPSGLSESEALGAWLACGWSEKEARHLARSGKEPHVKKSAQVQATAEVPQSELSEDHHAVKVGQITQREDKQPEKENRHTTRPDALFNEHRMRARLLRTVKANGWTGVGERELARRDGMPYGTARHTLKRMEDDNQEGGKQVERDRRKDKVGRRHGFRIIPEHPCWSDPKLAHLLALSNLSQQVKGEIGASLVTDK